MANDLENYLVKKSAQSGMPIRATLELTPLCNMNCEMCYIRHSAEEVRAQGGIRELNDWESLIPELKDLGVLFVSLIGGEPFLVPYLKELYRSLYKAGFYISLTTNGTLLADGLPDWITSQKPRYVVLSLYGASDETYEKVTGNPKGFTQAMQGLEHLRNAGIPVKLNYMVTPDNRQDLEEVLAISSTYQAPLLATAYCFPPIRKCEGHAIHRLSAKDCAYEEMRILKLQHPEQYEKQIAYLSAEDFQKETQKHTDHFQCYAGKSTFWINWKGEMVPCGMLRSIHLPVQQGNLSANWQMLRQKTAESKTSARCASCEKREVCQVCPAIMEAETGNLNQTPEYMCQITDEKIRLSKRMD